MGKRQRESGGGLSASASAPKREKRSRLQSVRAPCALPRLKDGQALVLLRYPAAFDLSLLEGCRLPPSLLTDALGSGETLSLQGGGQVRVSSAPRSVATSQGLYVAAVQPAAAADSGGEEAEDGGAPPTVSLLGRPAVAVLDLKLAPPQPPSLVPGLRRVTLTRRATVPKG